MLHRGLTGMLQCKVDVLFSHCCFCKMDMCSTQCAVHALVGVRDERSEEFEVMSSTVLCGQDCTGSLQRSDLGFRPQNSRDAVQMKDFPVHS